MTTHRIAIPEVKSNIDQFSFSVPLRTATLEFVFKWIDSIWRAFCYFPDGSVREAGVFPNAMNWEGFSDYKCVFVTDYEAIDKDNIASVSMFLVEL